MSKLETALFEAVERAFRKYQETRTTIDRLIYGALYDVVISAGLENELNEWVTRDES